MQFSKNTSNGISKGFLIKMTLVLIIITGAMILLSKIDFPSPNKEIEKIISNEKLKIVK
jgi:hydrogenase/urease accessory protein HupE|tara:strand:- start:832 stop:1008 length:177 start_codon:yes stop_codon:yes gene_type:complete